MGMRIRKERKDLPFYSSMQHPQPQRHLRKRNLKQIHIRRRRIRYRVSSRLGRCSGRRDSVKDEEASHTYHWVRASRSEEGIRNANSSLSGSEAKDDVASAAIKPRSRMLVYALIEGGIGGRARCMVNNDTRERDKDRDIDRDVNQNVIDLMNKRWASSKRILVQLRVALVHIHI